MALYKSRRPTANPGSSASIKASGRVISEPLVEAKQAPLQPVLGSLETAFVPPHLRQQDKGNQSAIPTPAVGIPECGDDLQHHVKSALVTHDQASTGRMGISSTACFNPHPHAIPSLPQLKKNIAVDAAGGLPKPKLAVPSGNKILNQTDRAQIEHDVCESSEEKKHTKIDRKEQFTGVYKLSLVPDANYRSIKSWDIPSPPLQEKLPEDVPGTIKISKVLFKVPTVRKILTAMSTTAPAPTKRYLNPLESKSGAPPTALHSQTTLSSNLPKAAPAAHQSPAPNPEPTRAPTLTLQKNQMVQTTSSYIIPPSFDPYKYGRPSTTRPDPSSKNSSRESRPIYGYSAEAEKHTYSTDSRTVVIKNFPPDLTLAMVSLVCKNAGKIETMSIFPTLQKARVSFVNATDATKFFTANGKGVEFEWGSKRYTITVQMKLDVDFLSSMTNTLVTKQGASRVVRIVGWDREGLEYLVNAESDEETYESLLIKLAELYSYKGLDNRVEGATWRKNEMGFMEACLIYSRIKDACCALVPLKEEIELGRCNITYGKDP